MDVCEQLGSLGYQFTLLVTVPGEPRTLVHASKHTATSAEQHLNAHEDFFDTFWNNEEPPDQSQPS